MKEYNIVELLEKLNDNKREMNAIVQDMAQMRRDYEIAILPLKEEYNSINNESSKIGRNIVFVKLNDLLDEICWLSETNVDDVNISLFANVTLDGEHKIYDFLQYISNPDDYNINFILSGKNRNGYLFNYMAVLSIKFDDVQSDGRTLFEHCSVVTKKRINGKVYSELVIDKDIENVILGVSLNYLSLDTNPSWRPADLFTQAVLNCEEREYSLKVDKVRKRIK